MFQREGRKGQLTFSRRWISADWSGWPWLDVNDNFEVKLKEQSLSKLTKGYLILTKNGVVRELRFRGSDADISEV